MGPSELNLARRLRLRDDSPLELKRVLLSGRRVTSPGQNEFADQLAAFANSQGGTLVMGVDDATHEVLGIPLDSLDAVECWVREICNDSVKPSLDVDILKLELSDASGTLVPVVRIEVSRGLFVHESPGGYFHRTVRSKREMAPDVLARLFHERSLGGMIRFDESPVPRTGPADLDYSLTRRFLPQDSHESVNEIAARRLRLVANDQDAAARLTLAGVLLGTREPQQWLPHACIQAISYAGERTDADYQTDARDIVGRLTSRSPKQCSLFGGTCSCGQPRPWPGSSARSSASERCSKPW